MGLNVSNRAARPYAEALIDIGRETGELSRIHDDLMDLVRLYRDDRQFRAFFTSPRLDPAEKIRVLKVALADKVCRPVLGLLHVLVAKGRELLLDNIADLFARFEDIAEGKIHVRVRTARHLPDESKAAITRKVEERTKRTVVLHETVDPDLIGGTIVRIGDLVVDGSLRRKLSVLRKALTAKERLY